MPPSPPGEFPRHAAPSVRGVMGRGCHLLPLQPAGDGLRERDRRGCCDSAGAQVPHQGKGVLGVWGQAAVSPKPLGDPLPAPPPAPAGHHRALRAFRGRGCCQLHQHPADETEVGARLQGGHGDIVGSSALALQRLWGGGGGAHTKRLVWGYQHLLASQELWVNASIPGCAHGVQPRAPTYHIVHGWGTWRDTDLPPCCVPDPLHPCCPYRELKVGIPITDENGNRLGESTAAAQKAIFQVVVSRIGMAAPAMGEYPALALAM